MKTHPGLETASTYLNVQMGETGTPWAAKPEGPYITISRESGTGGAALARALALRLNATEGGSSEWTVYTSNLINEMLQANHLSPRLARFLPEDHVSEIAASVGELVGLHPSLWELVQKTNDLIRRLARDGHAIIVGRGANFATKTIEHGVHVRLVAPQDHRNRHVAHLKEINDAAAHALNAKTDTARQRYVRTYFDQDVRDPTGYDLVIDVSRVHLSEATALITQLLASRTPALSEIH